MTALTLYHSTRCPYSRRVRLVLEALGVDYEDVEVDLERPPEWFEEISTGGTVPCIVHGDVNLVESVTIMEYLNETFQGDLMPKDTANRAYARNIVQWADDTWMPAFHRFEQAPDGPAARREMRDALDGLEDRFIGRGPFLVGRGVSLADVAVASTLTELPRLGLDVSRHPKTATLLEALLEWAPCQRVPTRPRSEVQVAGGR